MSLIQELTEARKTEVKKSTKVKKPVKEWAGDKYDAWHTKNKPTHEIYTLPEDTMQEIRNKMAGLQLQKKKLEDKRNWREASLIQNELSRLNLKMYKIMSVKESALSEHTAETKDELEQRISQIQDRQRELRDAGEHEAANNMNLGLHHYVKRLRDTGPVHKSNRYAHFYHPGQVYEGEEIPSVAKKAIKRKKS